MNRRCGETDARVTDCDPCSPPELHLCEAKSAPEANTPFQWFANMVDNCLEFAEEAHRSGKPIVGIMCEFAPRELIMAAGAIPVCLCGGAARTIPAAEEHLPANLCPLIKSTYGYSVLRENPFLEMASLVVAETTCDGKKKMFELMAEHRPVYVMELPQKQADPDAFEHWVREIDKLRINLETRLGTRITDEKLRDAVRVMNRERGLRRELAGFMRAEPPPITGRQLLDFKSIISGIPADLRQYARAVEMLQDGHRSGDYSGRVRVLLTGVPTVHGAERVVDIIEDSGGIIVCMENCTGLKPILQDVREDAEDIILALAEKYFDIHCAVMTRNERRLQVLRELAREYRAGCVIDLIWQACTTYDIESHMVKKTVENELGLPYLRIETDYSPSDSARIALRVEALFETVRGGRAR